MSKILIIDLLNKIANGKEIPKRIKFRGNILDYESEVDYINDDGLYLFNSMCCITEEDLNEEVEIIEEEKKIPEKLDLGNATVNEQQIEFKINEIIDYLKSKGDD